MIQNDPRAKVFNVQQKFQIAQN